ncbi:Protein detoxification 35 [Vitis vinifera]|uniref:Protein detoxification 35 n=1 Tax=Vitis vinifera TaxID=29760 RepID=A0A438E2Q5_VITVI|nr:Protein detoxification 35 [Vitis vinifera]
MRQSSSAPMETPLLKSGAERGYGGEGGDYPPLTTWREFGTNLVTTVFVGHIGNLELSAVSISVSVIGTFSFGFMVGFLFSLYTSILSRVFPFWVVTVIYEVCAWYGECAGDLMWTSLWCWTSPVAWVLLAEIMDNSISKLYHLLPIYIFATPILKALGQEDEIADLAGQFTLETIPQLFSLAIIFPTQKFLQAQK